jgi:protein-L-isoaspartate O-methyltransferase
MRLKYSEWSAGAALAILLFFALPAVFAFQPTPKPNQPAKLAPYVTSPQPIVEKMLDIAGLRSGETLYDLGCGDGRILFTAARQGARAVGVEINPDLVKKTRQTVETLSLQGRVQVVQGDMLAVDVSSADVVALYLITGANEMLRPKLERELRPGARVVSLEFEIKGWKPVRVEKIEAHRHPYKIYLYEVARR